MTFLLLWIESAAMLLVLAAAGLALAMPAGRRPVLRAILGLACCAPPLLVTALLATLAVLTHTSQGGSARLAAWFVTLAAVHAVGLATLWVRWRRRVRRPDEGAATWSPAVLWGWFLAAALMWFTTLSIIDLGARAHLASVRAEAGAIALSLLPPVADSDNAAYLYAQAFRLWGKVNDEAQRQERQIISADEPEVSGPAVTRVLGKYAPAIGLLHKAAALPHCRFEHDYVRPSVAMPLPELADMRLGAWLLRLHALREIAEGRPDSAARDVRAIFRMARHVAENPLLISALVSASIDGLAVKALERILPDLASPELLSIVEPPDLDTLRRLSRRAVDMEEAFGLSAIADVASAEMGLEVFEAVSTDSVAPQPTLLGSAGACVFRVFMLADELRAYRGLMARYRGLAGEPYHKARSALEIRRQDIRGVLSRMLVPALPRCFEAFATAQARNEAARMIVAAARYRLDNGRPPAGADELAGRYIDGVPTDPFDSGPMRFVVRDSTVIAYSVGPDGVDDGGKHTDDPRKGGDIVVRLHLRRASATAPVGR